MSRKKPVRRETTVHPPTEKILRTMPGMPEALAGFGRLAAKRREKSGRSAEGLSLRAASVTGRAARRACRTRAPCLRDAAACARPPGAVPSVRRLGRPRAADVRRRAAWPSPSVAAARAPSFPDRARPQAGTAARPPPASWALRAPSPAPASRPRQASAAAPGLLLRRPSRRRGLGRQLDRLCVVQPLPGPRLGRRTSRRSGRCQIGASASRRSARRSGGFDPRPTFLVRRSGAFGPAR